MPINPDSFTSPTFWNDLSYALPAFAVILLVWQWAEKIIKAYKAKHQKA